MSADDLELVFQTIDDLARGLSEAAFVKQEIGDPPTLWEALAYGFKNPGEIPGAVAESYQDAGTEAWNFAREKVKDAAAAVTPKIPWWAKAAAAAAAALAGSAASRACASPDDDARCATPNGSDRGATQMAIQKITATTLSTTFGCTVRYWERRCKDLLSAGLLNKIGSTFFGDLSAIERAIATGGPEIWSRSRPKKRRRGTPTTKMKSPLAPSPRRKASCRRSKP